MYSIRGYLYLQVPDNPTADDREVTVKIGQFALLLENKALAAINQLIAVIIKSYQTSACNYH
jgi:hypothetical protein